MSEIKQVFLSPCGNILYKNHVFTRCWPLFHPCLWTAEPLKDAPFIPIMILSPVTDKPVYPWNVPTGVFKHSTTFPVFCCSYLDWYQIQIYLLFYVFQRPSVFWIWGFAWNSHLLSFRESLSTTTPTSLAASTVTRWGMLSMMQVIWADLWQNTWLSVFLFIHITKRQKI